LLRKLNLRSRVEAAVWAVEKKRGVDGGFIEQDSKRIH
jgi:hypothetical protein